AARKLAVRRVLRVVERHTPLGWFIPNATRVLDLRGRELSAAERRHALLFGVVAKDAVLDRHPVANGISDRLERPRVRFELSLLLWSLVARRVANSDPVVPRLGRRAVARD